MTVQLPPSAASRSAYSVSLLPEPVQHRLLGLTEAEKPVSAYVYDPAVAVERARELRTALPEWVSVYYAMKANSFPGVLEALAPHVDGFEVASQLELQLALDTLPSGEGTSGDRPAVVSAGPGKSIPLLVDLVQSQVEVINAESLLELHRISRIASTSGITARVALRVNPAEIPNTGSLMMGGSPSQFGVAEPDVPDVLREALRLPSLDIVGFHIHAASNNLDADSQATYLRWCLDWSVRAARACGIELRYVDVGGGIGVAFGGEKPFDISRFGELIAQIAPPTGVDVVVEPGRFLVTDCGWYAAEVIDVKASYGEWFVVLRGGINHFLLPTCWDIIHNMAVLPVAHWGEDCPRPSVDDSRVTVVGELGTPHDMLLRDVRVDRVSVGDLVVFPNAGSYGWEFAMHSFLGHPVAERHLL